MNEDNIPEIKIELGDENNVVDFPTQGTEPQEAKSLDEKNLFALIMVEQQRDLYANTELKQAGDELRQAEEMLDRARRNITMIQGAIKGCEILIHNTLAKKQVPVAVYDAQKREYFQNLGTQSQS